MGLQDFIVTPALLLLVYMLAFLIRDVFSDRVTKKYFIPALSLKIIGAISLGLVYKYYYRGGDTFNYFDYGSKYIWEAFMDSPEKGLQLLFANGKYHPETYRYASEIIYYTDLPSYFVVRVTGFFDLFTFHTYSATAVLFALFSFSGIWAMFMSFYRLFPRLHLQFAVSLFFIPSVFFWGSGILKDSITLGALAWGTYAFIQIFFLRQRYLSSVMIMLISFFVIYEIKIYILLCFIPALMIWYYLSIIKNIRNVVLKAVIFPFSFMILIIGGYYSVKIIGQENRRYNLEKISYTAESTARWLSYVSEREEGSGYTLGDFDFSLMGIIRKTPAAIWVTLFRPYLWEVKNPAMFFAAMESLALLLFSIYVLFSAVRNKGLTRGILVPMVVFCLVFSITFAFAVGISTYNFGTLVRYKIPMIPFYLTGLFLVLEQSKRVRKYIVKSKLQKTKMPVYGA